MRKAFDRIENYNLYSWIAILVTLVTSIVYGIIKKYTNIITMLGRDYVYDMLERYIGEYFIFEILSRYIGAGITVILVIYILMLMGYIFIVFGIPNIVYCIAGVFFRKNINKLKSTLAWILCMSSFIPGILCMIDVITLITVLANINIILVHIICLIIIQCVLIVLYIIEAIKSFLYKEDIKNE